MGQVVGNSTIYDNGSVERPRHPACRIHLAVPVSMTQLGALITLGARLSVARAIPRAERPCHLTPPTTKPPNLRSM
jgi:hypothetical protein